MKLKKMKNLMKGVKGKNVVVSTKKKTYDKANVPEKVYEKKVKDIIDDGETIVIKVGKDKSLDKDFSSGEISDNLLKLKKEMDRMFSGNHDDSDDRDKLDKRIEKTKEKLEEVEKEEPRMNAKKKKQQQKQEDKKDGSTDSD